MGIFNVTLDDVASRLLCDPDEADIETTFEQKVLNETQIH